MDKICPKKVFPVQNRKSEHQVFVIFDCLDQIFKKKVFPIKKRKLNTTIDFCILELGLVANFSQITGFQLKLTILIFWVKFPQKGRLPSQVEKREHHHWILHVRIRLCTKFQCKLAILTGWTKFAKKGVSPQK